MLALLRLILLKFTVMDNSEQIVAQALSDVRDQAVYATKVFSQSPEI